MSLFCEYVSASAPFSAMVTSRVRRLISRRQHRERQTLARWRRHDERMRAVDLGGDLYAPTYEESMRRVLLDDFERDLDFRPETRLAVAPEVEAGHWTERGEGLPWCPVCHSWDLREFHHDHGFGCEGCRRPFVDVWGCLGCARVVCDDCLQTRRQAPRYYDMTLAEIGRDPAFEVGPERIRQIELKAIRKLQNPSRARRLFPFISGGDSMPALVPAQHFKNRPEPVDVEAAQRRYSKWLEEIESKKSEVTPAAASPKSAPRPEAKKPEVRTAAAGPRPRTAADIAAQAMSELDRRVSKVGWAAWLRALGHG